MNESRRELAAPAFPDDDGSADPVVRAALAEGGEAALAAVQQARLLVPVVAVLGEVEYDERGLAHDKSSDMAAVLLQAPNGRKGLLAFTGMDSMAAWNPEARPVPVPAQVAAQSALQEGASAILVDLAGPAMLAIEDDDLQGVALGWRLTRVDGKSAWLKS